MVTVLFADLVGFTSRAEQMDPEEVRSLLRPYHSRLRDELERFGGTVEKFIGDAVMAVFGAPVAHEDDAERAVRAGLAIRDWIVDEQAELQLRIGVNTGQALVSLDARPEEGEGMVAGDVVNTAARLQSNAPVNGILVGETTWRATRDAIDYRTPKRCRRRERRSRSHVGGSRGASTRRRRHLGPRADAICRPAARARHAAGRVRAGAEHTIRLSSSRLSASRASARAASSTSSFRRSSAIPSSSTGGRAARCRTARASASGRSARW